MITPALEWLGYSRLIRFVRATGRTAAFGVLTGLILAATLGATASAAGTRAESDQIVTRAEQTIRAAGKSNPVDEAKVHQAISELKQAIAVYPGNDSAYVDLGFCYSVLRDPQRALAMYTRAVRINPSGANFLELSDIYMRIGDSEHALMAANAGITKDPRNAHLYNAKGMALNDMQREAEAATAFQKAIDLDPNLQVARDNLHAISSGPNGRGSIGRH